MLVGRAKGELQVGTEVFKPGLTPGTGAVGVDQAPHCRQITRLVFRNCRADPGDTSDDLVAGDNRIDRGQELTPFVTDCMEI